MNSTALPTPDYRNPEDVAADKEQGDVMPATRPNGKLTCLQCPANRPSIDMLGRNQHPCVLGSMPAKRGTCRMWPDENGRLEVLLPAPGPVWVNRESQ